MLKYGRGNLALTEKNCFFGYFRPLNVTLQKSNKNHNYICQKNANRIVVTKIGHVLLEKWIRKKKEDARKHWLRICFLYTFYILFSIITPHYTCPYATTTYFYSFSDTRMVKPCGSHRPSSHVHKKVLEEVFIRWSGTLLSFERSHALQSELRALIQNP